MNLSWESVLAIEGHPTSDKRLLMAGEITERELPLSLMVMTVTDDGHDGAELGGKIESVVRMSAPEAHSLGLLSDDQFSGIREGAVVVVGYGVFEDSEFGMQSAERVDKEFLNGVSIDFAPSSVLLLDPETLEEVDAESLDIEDLLLGDFLTGMKGEIMGATVVPFAAFAESSIRLSPDGDRVAVVASGFQMRLTAPASPGAFFELLTAAGGPLKPPREWFDNPRLTKLTPLTITDEGRVYGHLADWSGCHTGFESMCVPPFRSHSDFAYFNVGEIETVDGALIPCGKVMFCMEGAKHAELDPRLSAAEVSKHYDDSTKVGAYVRAGSDRFGTWLSGVLRPGLTEAEVQHLRLHPPSGDWRPIPGKGTELVAAFSVPIPGFPIPRAMAASGENGELTIITGPLVVDAIGPREFARKKRMLRKRYAALLPEDDPVAV